jgi:hypothetical protein
MVVQPLRCGACDYTTPGDVNGIANMVQVMGLHNAQVHPTAPAPAVTAGGARDSGPAKLDRRARPEASVDMSEHDWRFFESEWEDYKTATGVSGPGRLTELWTCMTDELRRLAFNQGGKSGLSTEALMLARIKELAVTMLHAAVHTVELHEAKQAAGESIRLFAARVRGIAANCNLSKTCGCGSVSFVEETVYNVILAGIYSEEMQRRALAAAITKTVNNTAELLEFCAAEEASGRTAVSTVAGLRAMSSYRKGRGPAQESRRERPPQEYQLRADPDRPAEPPTTCRYCDGAAHSANGRDVRAKECPAFNVTCAICRYKGHITACHRDRGAATRLAPLEQDDPGLDAAVEQVSTADLEYMADLGYLGYM